MSVIANVRVPIENFEFGALFGRAPESTVRFERMVPVGDAFVPYVWLDDGDLSVLEAALEDDPHVEEFRVVDELGSEVLVRLHWSQDVDGLLSILLGNDGVILDGEGEASGWEFQLRFPDHEDLSNFFEGCLDRELSIEIVNVHNPGFGAIPDTGYRLTDTQRETLLTALELGYFEVPRSTNLVQLASELGISDTATSQRLRRGISALLQETIVNGEHGKK